MSTTNNIPSILETYILKPLFTNQSGIIFSACTGIATQNLYPCSGDTLDVHGSLSAVTIYGDAIYSGSTNIIDIINHATGSLTGGTFNGTVLTLSNSNGDVLAVTGFTDYFTTGVTFNNINSIATFIRNDGGSYQLNLSTLVSTAVSLTGGTYSNGTITFTNSTGGTFQVTGLIASAVTSTTLTNNILRVTQAGGTTTATTINAVTGGTFSAGTITFSGSGILSSITGITATNTFTTGFTYSSNTFTIRDNAGSAFTASINTVTGLTVNGALSANTFSVSATTNPVTIQGLSATTGDTNVLSVDDNGVIHAMPISSLSGATGVNNFNVFLTGNHSNDVLQPHATIAVKDKFYVGCGNNAVDGNIVCYNDPNDLTNKTTIVPFSAHMNSFYAVCYSSANDRIYTVGTVLTGSFHYNLAIINPNDNTYTIHALTGISFGDLALYGIDTDDTNVYIGSSDNRLFRYNLTTFIPTTLVLTGGNIIHDVRYVRYSDGAEIIATSTSTNFPIYSVDTATFTVSSSLSTAPLWTDDMALLKNSGNTVAAGCSFWLGAELGGHCIKYQSINRVISATSEEVTNSLSSYGLFTDGILVYNMSRIGYIEVWPFNLTSAQPIVNGIQYLVGTENVFGVPAWAPNELWISNSGKMFFTNYSSAGASTDSGIYEFKLSPAPIGNPLNTSITGVTLSNNVLSVTKNNFTATTSTINAVTGGSYSNGIITFSGSGVLGSITGLTTGTTLTNSDNSLIISGGVISLNTTNSNTWTTGQTITVAGTQLTIGNDGTNKATFQVDSSGKLLISPSSGVIGIGKTGAGSVNAMDVGGSINSDTSYKLGNSTFFSRGGGTSTFVMAGNGTIQATAGVLNLQASGNNPIIFFNSLLVAGSTGAASQIHLNTGATPTATTLGDIYFDSGNTFNLNGNITTTVNNLGAVTGNTSGLTLVNSTSATTVLTQSSPAIILQGQGWKSNSTAGTKTVEFRKWLQPLSGGTNPQFSVYEDYNIASTGSTLFSQKTYNGVIQSLNIAPGANAAAQFAGFQMYSFGFATLLGGMLANTQSGEIRMGAFAGGGYFPTFFTNGGEAARIASTGRVLINTTTDDGLNQVQINATTNPLRLIGLSATSADTSMLSVDTNGTVHKSNVASFFPNGQVTLSAGTKTIAVTGVLTTSKGFPAIAAASGFTNTIEYLVSCSTNTVLIKALNSSGGTNVSDVSTVNYFVII